MVAPQRVVQHPARCSHPRAGRVGARCSRRRRGARVEHAADTPVPRGDQRAERPRVQTSTTDHSRPSRRLGRDSRLLCGRRLMHRSMSHPLAAVRSSVDRDAATRSIVAVNATRHTNPDRTHRVVPQSLACLGLTTHLPCGCLGLCSGLNATFLVARGVSVAPFVDATPASQPKETFGWIV